jgi:hypothetical protein
MPIQHAIWKVGTPPTPLKRGKLASEQALEEMIVREPSVLSAEWMLIGRQEQTGFGGRIDLLAIAPDGSLVLIELKRNRTPREIVAQALDYAAWVEKLTADRIGQIYRRFSGGGSLASAFAKRFGAKLDEETLNESHQIVLVAAELDDASERIIQYLNDRDIAINVLFFQVFDHGPDQLLSRAWLIDLGETQVNALTTPRSAGERERWNGEFYVSFGESAERSWDEARRFGFVCAGGGAWYSRTLSLLKEGDRIWVRIPGAGYVGVGLVTGPRVRIADFEFKDASGAAVPPQYALTKGGYHAQHRNNPDDCEWFVPVQWLQTRSVDESFSEIGLFGNQNTVCQPTTPKWRHTVERLKNAFPQWNAGPAHEASL